MISKLIKSNFKNDFSHMITFFLIMVLAVFMLHTGLAILLGYSTLHKDKKEEYNFADIMVQSILPPEDKEKIEEIINNSEYIESYEKLHPVMMEFSRSKEGAEEDSKNMYDTSDFNLLILPYGEWGEMEAPHFVELSDEEYENPIYISIYFNSNYIKAELGDDVDLKVGDKYYTFQVAGIYESLLGNGLGLTYVSPDLFNEWKTDQDEKLTEARRAQKEKEALESESAALEQTDDLAEDGTEEQPLYDMTLFFMKVSEGTDLQAATGQLTKSFSDHSIRAYAVDVDMIITSFTFMQNMIAAMLAAFAIIITVISMIIIYFRISNSIEQNIVNIGALKALGYTSKQIRLSMISEFSLATLFAIFTGIGASYAVIPVFEKFIRGFSGVEWDHPFDMVSLVITVVLMLGTVVLVSFMSTRMIKKLDPVVALRFGINSHSFKKNHAPIEKTAGPLTWIMALKSVLSNTKQNVILIVVMLSIGIVTTFSVFLAYNCVKDPTHLYRMLQLVGSDVTVSFSDEENVIDDILKLPEVESVWWQDTVEMTVEGYSVYAYIADDWTSISDVNVYEGRSPIYDNEIAIGGSLANTLGVSVGDEVEVSYANTEKKFLITGIEQDSSNMGKDISMVTDGAKHFPTYEPVKDNVSLFVKGHTLNNSKTAVEKIQDMYGDKITGYGNVVETIRTGDEPVVAIAAAMVAVMVAVSLAVIILSLNLLVKTMIIKKQQEIGIKKAIGFSSDQLRTELVLSMLPQILIGAAAGSILGSMWSNKILATLLSSMGIMRSNMEMFPWMAVLSVIFACIASFAIIWIISGRIKRISAYSLITE